MQRMFKTLTPLIVIYFSNCFASITHVEVLANKYYISKKLISIYGKQAKPYIKKYILSQSKVFGGSCDPYSFEKENKKVSGQKYECFKGLASLRSGDYGHQSVTRELLMEKACQAITKDKIIQKGLRKNKFSYHLVNNYYHKFIRTNDFKKSAYVEINKMKIPISKKWTLLSKVLCRSKEWQKI